jgi:ATP-binding cassette, subfamily B, bacterial PglK
VLKLVRRTLAVLSPKYRRRVLILAIGAFLSALVDAAAFGLLYPFIQLLTTSSDDLSSSALRITSDVFFTDVRHTLEVRLGVTILVLFVISSVLGIALTYAQSRVAAGSEAEVSIRLFGRYLRAPYAEHLNRNSSELVRNVLNAVGDVHQLVLLPMLIISSNMLQALIIAVVLALISPLVTAMAITYFLLVSLLYIKVVSPRARRAGRDYLSGAGEVVRISQEAFGGIKSLQAFDALDPMDEDFQRTKWRFARQRHAMVYYSALPQYYLQSALIVGMVLFAAVIFITGAGNVTALIGLVMAASIKLMPALYQSLGAVNRIGNGAASLDAIDHDLTRLGALADQAEAELPTSAGPSLPEALRRGIEFTEVSFRYPRSDEPVVDRVSFTIPIGHSVALVGRSGAGKTTIVDLLLGLFPITSGGITVDGVPLDRRTLKDWRRRVGYVPQEVFLLDGSIADNIRFSRMGEQPPTDELWASLERSQLSDFVATLPDGIDTVVGERGVRLSGGQRQRLGIARALFRDPEFLILDEATSALDTATEAAVAETITSLRGSLTMIIIAHRLSTVRDCDLLLLMEDGRVVAEGDFDSLRRDSELFSEFARLSHIEVG